MIQNKLLQFLKKGNSVLIHGNHGTGKTHLVKNIIPKLKNKTFYLICPLEPNEFENIIFGLKNNSRKNIVIDNLESANAETIRSLTKFIQNKHKNTLLICICKNIYDSHLKTIKTKFDELLKIPILSIGEAMKFSQKKNVSDETLEIIAKFKPNDYRQLLKIIRFHSKNTSIDKSEENTFIGENNYFKTFEWILGKKHDANLEYIINSEPILYTNAFLENYPHRVNTLNELDIISKNLSDIDTFSHWSDYRDYSLAHGAIHIQTKNQDYSNLRFPRFIRKNNSCSQGLSKICREHFEFICSIIKFINASRITQRVKMYFTNTISNLKNISNFTNRDLESILHDYSIEKIKLKPSVSKLL